MARQNSLKNTINHGAQLANTGQGAWSPHGPKQAHQGAGCLGSCSCALLPTAPSGSSPQGSRALRTASLKKCKAQRACLSAGRCNSRVGHATPAPPSPPAPAPQTSSAAAERAALRAPWLLGRASAMRLCGSSAPRTGVGRTKPRASHLIVTHDGGRRR